jgi:hypothetical protein
MGVVSDCYCYVVYQQQQEIKVVLIQATGDTYSLLWMIQAMSVTCTKTTLEETHKKVSLIRKTNHFNIMSCT